MHNGHLQAEPSVSMECERQSRPSHSVQYTWPCHPVQRTPSHTQPDPPTPYAHVRSCPQQRCQMRSSGCTSLDAGGIYVRSFAPGTLEVLRCRYQMCYLFFIIFNPFSQPGISVRLHGFYSDHPKSFQRYSLRYWWEDVDV